MKDMTSYEQEEAYSLKLEKEIIDLKKQVDKARDDRETYRQWYFEIKEAYENLKGNP